MRLEALSQVSLSGLCPKDDPIDKTSVWGLLTRHETISQDKYCATWAKDHRVGFLDGSVKLCGRSGLWNANLGYGNLAVADAARDALLNASYLPVWGYDHIYARKAASALIEATGRLDFYGRVLFSTSGGAANDAAMKLARHRQSLCGHSGKDIILGLKGGYHGLTFGSFALSDVKLGSKMYGVDRRSVGHVPPNDPDALCAVLDRLGSRLAAIVVEPVIGNGAVVLSDAFLNTIFKGRRSLDYLVICDEVATGFGRAGPELFASRSWLEAPDVIIAAKGMTNGTQAASALIVSSHVAQLFDRCNALLAHAETQAGTPVVCASILATLSEMRRLDILSRMHQLSERLESELAGLANRFSAIVGVSGQGCMWAINLDSECAGGAEGVGRIVDAVYDAGALIHPGPDSLLLMPALTYSSDDVAELLGAVEAGLIAIGID